MADSNHVSFIRDPFPTNNGTTKFELANLSYLEILSSSQRLKMNYCHRKEFRIAQRVLYQRCILLLTQLSLTDGSV